MKDLDLNTSADLPASSASTAGATANSLGDASMADLKRGFFNGNDTGFEDTFFVAHDSKASGVVGRPCGYER